MNRCYTLSDTAKEQHKCIPTAFFTVDFYKSASNDAKILYTLLHDRLSLSRKNNWANNKGEIYIKFSREEAAEVLNISLRKVVGVFNELNSLGLIREEKQGCGQPNIIYVLKLELSGEQAEEMFDAEDKNLECEDTEEADNENKTCKSCTSDVQNLHPRRANSAPQTCKNCTSLLSIKQTNSIKTNSINLSDRPIEEIILELAEKENIMVSNDTMKNILQKSEFIRKSKNPVAYIVSCLKNAAQAESIKQKLAPLEKETGFDFYEAGKVKPPKGG